MELGVVRKWIKEGVLNVEQCIQGDYFDSSDINQMKFWLDSHITTLRKTLREMVLVRNGLMDDLNRYNSLYQSGRAMTADGMELYQIAVEQLMQSESNIIHINEAIQDCEAMSAELEKSMNRQVVDHQFHCQCGHIYGHQKFGMLCGICKTPVELYGVCRQKNN